MPVLEVALHLDHVKDLLPAKSVWIDCDAEQVLDKEFWCFASILTSCLEVKNIVEDRRVGDQVLNHLLCPIEELRQGIKVLLSKLWHLINSQFTYLDIRVEIDELLKVIGCDVVLGGIFANLYNEFHPK